MTAGILNSEVHTAPINTHHVSAMREDGSIVIMNENVSLGSFGPHQPTFNISFLPFTFAVRVSAAF